jgi:hypothetical protein
VDSLKALDPKRPIREADIDGIKILQCSDLLPHRLVAAKGGRQRLPRFRTFQARPKDLRVLPGHPDPALSWHSGLRGWAHARSRTTPVHCAIRRRSRVAARGTRAAGRKNSHGYLWHAGSPEEEVPYFGALQEGFARLGYVDGRNIRLEHRFPNEMPERFKSMAAELVALNVDVLMGGAIASSYLRDATTKIPIVFMFVPDPVGMRFVQSIAKPGGNITGLSNFGRDIAGKRLQLLKELVPGLTRVALLINSDQQTTPVFVEVMGAAADQLGLPFQLPTKYDLVINVKTARALGLKIPPNLLFTAEEVIE